MTHEELQAFRDRFNEIKKGKEPTRSSRLVNLMHDLKESYNIPILNDESYNRNNPEVVALYREVSKARQMT